MKTLRERLANWTPLLDAASELGITLGLWPDNDEEPVRYISSLTFKEMLPLLGDCIDALIQNGVLELDLTGSECRWCAPEEKP